MKKGTLPLRWVSSPGPYDCRSNSLSSELRRFHNSILSEVEAFLFSQKIPSIYKEGDCFRYLENKFPSISDAKLKAGIFDGPQIRKLLNDDKFIDSIYDRKKAARISFKEVVEIFLVNFKRDNYKKIVKNMQQKFEEQICLMSIKLHFLYSHLEHFPENLGDYSEEQGECFHPNIKEMR